MTACICVYLSVKVASQSLLPTLCRQFAVVQRRPMVYTTTMPSIAKLECLDKSTSSGVIESLNKETISHDDF